MIMSSFNIIWYVDYHSVYRFMSFLTFRNIHNMAINYGLWRFSKPEVETKPECNMLYLPDTFKKLTSHNRFSVTCRPPWNLDLWSLIFEIFLLEIVSSYVCFSSIINKAMAFQNFDLLFELMTSLNKTSTLKFIVLVIYTWYIRRPSLIELSLLVLEL